MDRINLETYPKSGTGYLYSSLKLSFLNYLIDFPSHSIYGLNRKNLITIVRNPKNSIASWAFETKNSDIKSLENWYVRFLQKIELRKTEICIVNFDDFINNHDIFLEGFAKKFNLKGYKRVSNQAVLNYMSLKLPNNLPQKNKAKEVFIANIQKTYAFEKSLFWYNSLFNGTNTLESEISCQA